MKKFILLGDMHIGARSASPVVMEHQLSYFEQIMFPYMKEHDINTILQLGDIFDTRKFSNHYILHWWKVRFFKYLEQNDIEFITILGNHDIFFKNTTEVNTTRLFLEDYDNITIIDKPTSMVIEHTSFDILPWICDENRAEIMEHVKSSVAPFCAGHFEFSGFEYNLGQMATDGDDHTKFSRYDRVFSGHYHTRSEKDNIEYIGIPYELTWIDFADPKGFTVFDPNTMTTEFVRNERSLFVKMYYDDKDEPEDYWKTIDVSVAEKSYVKLIVAHKTNPVGFDHLMEKITIMQPIDVRVMDVVEDFTDIEVGGEEIDIEDTPTLIEKFVDQTDTDLEKSRVTTMMKNLFVEALNHGDTL